MQRHDTGWASSSSSSGVLQGAEVQHFRDDDNEVAKEVTSTFVVHKSAIKLEQRQKQEGEDQKQTRLL